MISSKIIKINTDLCLYDLTNIAEKVGDIIPINSGFCKINKLTSLFTYYDSKIRIKSQTFAAH